MSRICSDRNNRMNFEQYGYGYGYGYAQIIIIMLLLPSLQAALHVHFYLSATNHRIASQPLSSSSIIITSSIFHCRSSFVISYCRQPPTEQPPASRHAHASMRMLPTTSILYYYGDFLTFYEANY